MFSRRKACKICNNSFIAITANGKYCSNKCRTKAKAIAQKAWVHNTDHFKLKSARHIAYNQYKNNTFVDNDNYHISKIDPTVSKPTLEPTPVPDLGFKVYTEPKTILVLNHKRDEERSSWR